MQALPKEFTHDGFNHRQIDRQRDVAVYEKRHRSGGAKSYEVVVVQKRPATRWPDGTTTPAREAMPSTEQWGQAGWSYVDRASAYRKMAATLHHKAKNGNSEEVSK